MKELCCAWLYLPHLSLIEIRMSLMDCIQRLMADASPWLVPLVLLILQFLFKIYINGTPSGSIFWKSFLQSPVEIGFLGLSFIAAAGISELIPAPETIGWFVFFLLLNILIIIIWKHSPVGINSKQIMQASFLAFLNFAISIAMLVVSINLLIRRTIAT